MYREQTSLGGDIGLEWQSVNTHFDSYRSDAPLGVKGKKCPGGYTIAANKQCRTGNGVRTSGKKRGIGIGAAALAAGALAAGGAYVKKERQHEEEMRRRARRELASGAVAIGVTGGLSYGLSKRVRKKTSGAVRL